MGKTKLDLEFDLFTAEVRALASNAVLIKGRDEAVLVDNCLIQSDAEKLVTHDPASGRELTTVLVTHAHPDHYFGLAAITDAFPSRANLCPPTSDRRHARVSLEDRSLAGNVSW